MRLSIWMLLLVSSAPFLTGCDQDAVEQDAKPRAFQGTVDTTLPLDKQTRQHALKKFLGAMQEGVGDVSGLSIYAPGIDFRGRYEDFNGTSGRLVRWEFNGQPSGNDVPVVLFFTDQTTGLVEPENEKRQEKVYSVAPAGRRFTITPKK